MVEEYLFFFQNISLIFRACPRTTSWRRTGVSGMFKSYTVHGNTFFFFYTFASSPPLALPQTISKFFPIRATPIDERRYYVYVHTIIQTQWRGRRILRCSRRYSHSDSTAITRCIILLLGTTVSLIFSVIFPWCTVLRYSIVYHYSRCSPTIAGRL